MLNQTRPVRFSLFALALLAGAVGFSPFFPARAVVAPIIDFENINTGGLPGGTVKEDTYAARGVVFKPVLAKDFSSLGSGFTHSGKLALALCEGQENCTSPLEVSFTQSQKRVKVWIGFSGPLPESRRVRLTAYDGGGTELTFRIAVLGPSAGPIPIAVPLLVSQPVPLIARVTVSLVPDFPGQQITNNGLAVDDVEFEFEGPPPPCPVAQAPFFTVSKPTGSQVFVQNAFTVEANLPRANSDASLRIDVTGQGQSRSSAPFPVSPGNITFNNLGGLLFAGLNNVVFTINDCGGSYGVQRTVFYRPDVTHTPILVIDESNRAVPGAEIFIDSVSAGRTDQNGIFNAAPPLPDGTRVVARKFVHESPTWRKVHAAGSTRNWNYRAYISNLSVNDDGSVSAHSVQLAPNPLANQVVRVLRRNALIGAHLLASIEWDASDAEIETVRERIRAASRVLYNATDGQFFIEQVEVFDNSRHPIAADIYIYADQSMTANVPAPLGAFLGAPWWGDSIVRIHVNTDSPTLAHELGHYGFGLDDEYEAYDDGPATICTGHIFSDQTPNNPYRSGAPQASCLMYDNNLVEISPGELRLRTPKFCSDRPENPHLKNTDQGSESCWDKIAGGIDDCPPLLRSCSNQRWFIRTPDNRGAIPGEIRESLPLNSWATLVTVDNMKRPNLCQPITFRATTPDGTPLGGRSVWLRTTYGALIGQGKTASDGRITVTGLHFGDRVNNQVIELFDCEPTAFSSPPRVSDAPRLVGASYSNTTASSRFASDKRLIEHPPAFHIFTELKPIRRDDAEIEIQIKTLSGQTLTVAKPPEVKVHSPGNDVLPIPVSYNVSKNAYVGKLRRITGHGQMVIDVTATDTNGRRENSIGSFAIRPTDPTDDTEMSSPDGQLTLRIPPNVLPARTRISIGAASAPEPILPLGYEIVSGPFALWSSPDNCLPRFVRLSFNLARQGEESKMTGYVRQSFRMLRYDPGMRRWEDMGGIVHAAPIDVVSQRTSQLGNFVLVAQRESPKRPSRFPRD